MFYRHKPIIVTAFPQNGEDEITHNGNWILTEEDGTESIVSTELLDKYYYKYFKIDSYYNEYLCKKLKLREPISVYEYGNFKTVVKGMSLEDLLNARSFAKIRIKNIDDEFKVMDRGYKQIEDELAHFGAYCLHDHEYDNYNNGIEYLQEGKQILKTLINVINGEVADRTENGAIG